MQGFFSNSFTKFRNNRNYSLFYLLILLVICTFAEFITNNQPIILLHDNKIYLPIINRISEADLGGSLSGDADFNSSYVKNLVKDSLYIMPPFHNHYSNYAFWHDDGFPSPPSDLNILGTDDRGLDVLANVIYGLRTAIIFGTILTFFSTIIGIIFAALTGFYGGIADLIGQRFLEIWGALPALYILIILTSIITPSFAWLLIVNLLFNWTALVYVVRAEFLKARNLEYVIAAKSLGVSDLRIIFRHILPNALNAAISFIPFILVNSITTLSVLDFLGLGLPYGDASLGEMINQAKSNLFAPWILISVTFFMISLLASLLAIGNSLRNSLDPRS